LQKQAGSYAANVNNDFMKAVTPENQPRSLFPFLHGGPWPSVARTTRNVIAQRIGASNHRAPSTETSEIATRIVNLGVAPRFLVVKAEFYSRNPTVAAVGHPFYLDWLL